MSPLVYEHLRLFIFEYASRYAPLTCRLSRLFLPVPDYLPAFGLPLLETPPQGVHLVPQLHPISLVVLWWVQNVSQ